MQNFGQNTQRTSILKELSGGNVELGEAFALIIADMVMQTGITNPKAEPFDVVPDSWRKLADKPDKTQEDFQTLDKTFKEEVDLLAQSYLLYMARETRNLTGKIDYAQYEAYMLKYRFGRYDVMNRYNNFLGFQINGLIKPEDYAVNESNLFEADDNLFSVKLRLAYKILNNQL